MFELWACVAAPEDGDSLLPELPRRPVEARARGTGIMQTKLDWFYNREIESFISRNGGFSVQMRCQECGKTTMHPLSRVREGKGRFCSRDCFHNYFRENLSWIHLNLSKEKEFAYIGGVYCGDGSSYYQPNNENYITKLEVTSKEFRDSFARALKAVGCHVYTSSRKRTTGYGKGPVTYYLARASSKELHEVLAKHFKDRKSVLSFLSTNDEKSEFIRGLYESDGSHFQLSNGKKWIIQVYQKCLEDLGIDSGITTSDKEFRLFLKGKNSARRFIETINPVIKKPSANVCPVCGGEHYNDIFCSQKCCLASHKPRDLKGRFVSRKFS